LLNTALKKENRYERENIFFHRYQFLLEERMEKALFMMKNIAKNDPPSNI